MKTKAYIILLALLLCNINPSIACRVLYIGDSITDGGWGRSGGSAKASKDRNHWDMNHIFGQGYVMLCASYFQSEYPDSLYEFYNRGISGNTLSDLKERWAEDVLSLQPDILSVLIGTNDVNEYLQKRIDNDDSAFDYDGWENTYRQLLTQARQDNPSIHLVLCTPFVAKEGKTGQAADYALRKQMIDSLSVIIGRIAEDYHAVLVPFGLLFDTLIEKQPRPAYWIWDGIHPTPAGHRRMSDLWIRRTRHLLPHHIGKRSYDFEK